MAQSSFPFGSSQITTEDQWSSYMRMAQVDGVFATSESATNLKVTASNLSTVSVAAGEAWIQGTYYGNSTALNVNVPTNSGGISARSDLIVLRRDPAADATTVQYKTGGTSFPSLTQALNGTWEIPLARVTVAAGASVVAPSGVTDVRWFVGRPAVFGSSAYRRPPVRGQIHIDNGTDLYLGDGSNWNYLGTAEEPAAKTYTPVWDAGGTVLNWGTGSVNVGRYKRLAGNLYWVKIQLQPAGNPGPVDQPIRVTLPFDAQGSTRDEFVWTYTQDTANGNGSTGGVAHTYPTTDGVNRIARFRILTSSGTSSMSTVSTRFLKNNDPFNIKSGDVLTVAGTYEIA
ncbi:hypothetical protein [Streptomyces sp. PanSC9]|uniref:hypothetical protein n=1 Tax=Streptomyces sp. PanSC9 TaxID=1520461 RepID=UPI000F47A3A5|nr:hypothetical protein [Streptomyces sp. PanSC9]ROP53268.1 hypothetical protein EDD94_2771 [Streptomyces sp. PanSC9]